MGETGQGGNLVEVKWTLFRHGNPRGVIGVREHGKVCMGKREWVMVMATYLGLNSFHLKGNEN